MPKRLNAPFRCFEIGERNTAIVLNDGRAVIEQKLPNAGKMPVCRRYEALLMRLSAGPSLARNAEKPLR